MENRKTLISQSAYDELESKEGKYSSEHIESYFTLFELLLAPKSNPLLAVEELHFTKQGSMTSGEFHSHIVKGKESDDQLISTSPPNDEYIMEIRQQWIPTPFTEQATVFQDLQQDFQVSNAEFSLDLHVPNVSPERIHAPLVVHND